jgi:predicted nuclease of restriction endonuclease-like (RecB) superfamily
MAKKLMNSLENDFDEIHQMITISKSKALQQVNQTLISLYWNIGAYISKKSFNEHWGQSTVEELARYISTKDFSYQGFSARNIWRMKKFYETYAPFPKLSTLLTEIGWSNHLHILSKTKTLEEKEYYLMLTAKNKYKSRDLARLIDSSSFERTTLANKKLSTVLTEFPHNTMGVFKDSYVFEFLNLPDDHLESDLRRGLVKNLTKFLLELGPDFTLMGEEYPIQVGNKDFRIDLLMFHRGLNAMCAVELKISEFHPAHIGQLQFYLEALDRDIKKTHENPSVGILICKSKDDEVVKYTMNRSMSPTMIAEYETKLINKKLLQEKLHEISLSLEDVNDDEEHLQLPDV